MSPESGKENQGNSPAAQEEEAPKKTGLCVRLKLSKPMVCNEAKETEEGATECGSQESKTADGGSRGFVCRECGRSNFISLKAVYGHMRTHPGRGHNGVNEPARGVKRPASLSSPGQAPNVSGWVVKAKRGRGADQDPRITAAQALTTMRMFRMTIQMKAGEACKALVVAPPDRKCIVAPPDLKCSSSAPAMAYNCVACDRSFPTHQALGGHMASHNRNNLVADEVEGAAAKGGAAHGRVEGADANGAAVRATTMEHRCNICSEKFASGQALGGHKRKHYTGPLTTKGSLPSVENARTENHGSSADNYRAPLPDLNEAPPQSEEADGGRGPALG